MEMETLTRRIWIGILAAIILARPALAEKPLRVCISKSSGNVVSKQKCGSTEVPVTIAGLGIVAKAALDADIVGLKTSVSALINLAESLNNRVYEAQVAINGIQNQTESCRTVLPLGNIITCGSGERLKSLDFSTGFGSCCR